ncbi:MAG: DUF4124 domain-containing protein [Rhodanobacteraceae bacterium]
MIKYSRIVTSVALCLACSALGAAQGGGHNRYKWRDSQGNLHYSDSLPSDASVRGYDVINASGLVIQHVDRAQTAQERAAARRAAEQNKASSEQASNTARADQQLLAAYPNESDLEHAQQLQLDYLDKGIDAARVDLKNQETSLSDMLDHAAEFDRIDKPVPASLARQVSKMRARTRNQRDAVSRKVAERAQTVRQFADELAHYRKLKAAADADRQR